MRTHLIHRPARDIIPLEIASVTQHGIPKNSSHLRRTIKLILAFASQNRVQKWRVELDAGLGARP